MATEVTVPPVGESITEGILVEWLKPDGEYVEIDEPLFVLETDKVTMTINAAASGRLAVSAQAGETVQIGQVVGSLDTDAARPEPMRDAAQEEEKAQADPEPQVPQTVGLPISAPAGLASATAKSVDQVNRGELSPAVRRMVEEFKVDPGALKGTGKAGRITKEDVLEHLKRAVESQGGKPEPEEASKPLTVVETASKEPPGPKGGDPLERRQTRTRMSPIRMRIAERLVMAQNTAAILTTFNEADMSEVMAWRKRHQEAFKEKYGVKLGFMSFFIQAVVEALEAVPSLNAQIQGDEIVQNHFYDIGFAVGTDRGLVVPVIRDADGLSFGEVEREILRLAERARSRTITLAEITGGVFTVSNGGVYGNLLSTPILNPPQSGILGMHIIQKRPVVVDDEIQIRPMMYLALSYDHRLVDGEEAVSFLKRVKECIEAPERMVWEM